MTDGEHGLLAPLDDHEALAARVLRLLAEPDYARQLAHSAHAESAQYTWSAVRAEWLRAYRDAVSQSARRHPAPVVTPAGADR
jgi:glycosyltransferase involved in cell wall biosynthesis